MNELTPKRSEDDDGDEQEIGAKLRRRGDDEVA